MTYIKSDITTDDDINIVEMLRIKTEEADMNSYLKSTFGGYTKKSVLDYLAILRKQQQTMADNFNSNLQTLLDEKENIKKSKAALLTKLSKIESEYQNLSEAMLASKSDNQDYSVQDIPSLKSMIAAMEEEQKKGKSEIYILEQKIEQLENTNQNLVLKLKQANQATDSHKEVVTAEKLETKKQRDLVTELSNLLEGARDEAKYWKGLQFDGQVAELTATINEVTEQLSVQTELIARQNTENKLKEQQIENLISEVITLKNTIESLSESLNSTNLQNDKLLHANKALTEQMEEENKKILALIQEKSDANIEKYIAYKKLSEAESKVSMLHMELNKNMEIEEISSIK